MIDVEKQNEHDIEYMRNLRKELESIGVHWIRLHRLEMPLTARQVAYAIRSYIVAIEKRKNKRRIK